jgi:uncharacterized protein YcsI (UPF0317 family)
MSPMTQAVSKTSRADIAPSLAVRLACREGSFTGPTAGLAPGFVQGNLVVLPQDLTSDFLRFCQLNPKPCPLIGISNAGDPQIPSLGLDLDIRTDLPGYRVWQNGEIANEPSDVLSWWRNDLVAFVIGCSLSFEEALLAEGLPLRHVAKRARVPMYRSNIECRPAGLFAGPMVVSMRPLAPSDAIRAIQITSRYPAVHGAPVHIGIPEAIGIGDLARPDYGDPVEMLPGELPVFWACGVTPQAIIASVRPQFAITHGPGLMLVTDLRNSHLAVI